MATKRTVLITGCSAGGLGDALARAFHDRGLRVIATARSESKMAHFKSIGIETLVMDVVSPDSIARCLSKVSELTEGVLDILVNNSGGGYSMPLVDVSLDAGRELFDLNVWSLLGVTQSFLPLLLKSKLQPMIVNNTSIASLTAVPMQGIYNASKAAAAMLTDNLRLELEPFGIKVVELKTGNVKSEFFNNQKASNTLAPRLPPNSIYAVARDAVQNAMEGRNFEGHNMPSDLWAKQVVGELLSAAPPIHVWKGTNSFWSGLGAGSFPLGSLTAL